MEIEQIVVEIRGQVRWIVVSQLRNRVHCALEVCARYLHSFRTVACVHAPQEGVQCSDVVQNASFLEADVCDCDVFA